MEVVSTSNHLVYRHGEKWVKKPRKATETARVEMARDVAANRALGRTVEVEDGAMVLEHLGDPVDPEHFHIAEVAQHLRTIHQAPVSERDLLSLEDWRVDVVEKVEERLADHSDAHTWARGVLAAAGPAPAAEVGGLAVSEGRSRGRLALPATPEAIPARIRLMEASPYWAG